MKPRKLARAFVLGLTLALLAAALPAQTAPSPQAPANQGNQPAPAGPAPKTARQPARPAAAQAKPWDHIPIPPLPEFHAPVPKRLELANGMVIFLQEDHELPLITLSARVRGGSILEPAAKAGLVSIYGDVWRNGGTKDKTGDQMDDLLEARAAKIETDGDQQQTTISLNCLKDDFDAVFALYLQLMRQPAFRPDKLALAQQQMDTQISRRNEDIDAIAGREARRLAYGPDNPYARIPEYQTVAAVTRDDLVDWHARFVHPNNILLGVVGDFDAARMETILRQAFDSWSKGPATPRPELSFTPAPPGFYYAAKQDVNQSVIRMVTLGIERNNPDYFAVSVMNEILGGGMSSRLFKTIRTQQGLAYSVGGGLGAAYDHPGIFALGAGTKTSTTARTIKSLDEQVRDLLKEPATPAELRQAKDSILNSFIFSIDTPEKVLAERMTYEFYGYPLDFLERLRAGVEKVTVGEVERVAHKYVKPGVFAVLVVGNSEADQQLSSLGPVKTLDIAIPPPAHAENAVGGR